MKLIIENWREFIKLNEAADPVTIENIKATLEQAGGESYIVGGAVRDELMPDAPPPKDIDFLVRGLPLSEIAATLSSLGKVKEVGQAFGVVTANIDGEDFDFAIPRTSEVKTGEKHTEFDVKTDPYASVQEDLSRRDFTINALAKNSAGDIIDLFGGQKDLKNKIIRVVGEPQSRFREDPLRMLRALQFATRFDFSIEPKTLDAIRKNAKDVKSIAGERVLMELVKAWTKGSDNTDKLVSLLKDTGIGEAIFGDAFDPQAVKIEGDNNDKTIGNFIAFFLKGGNYNIMHPAKEIVQYLELAHQAAESRKEVYEYAAGQRERLPLIANVLRQLKMTQQADKLEKALELPLSPVELDIGGNDIMKLGLQGPEIGNAFKRILAAVHNGQIDNSYNDIIGFIG